MLRLLCFEEFFVDKIKRVWNRLNSSSQDTIIIIAIIFITAIFNRIVVYQFMSETAFSIWVVIAPTIIIICFYSFKYFINKDK